MCACVCVCVCEQRAVLGVRPDVLVATPARVVAALKEKLLPVFDSGQNSDSSLEMMVLDEADLLLSYGAHGSVLYYILAFHPPLTTAFHSCSTQDPLNRQWETERQWKSIRGAERGPEERPMQLPSVRGVATSQPMWALISALRNMV